MIDLERSTKGEREAYEAGLAEQRPVEVEAAITTPGKTRWAAGGVAGGGISTAALANVLTWMLPEGAPALDIAALVVGIGGLLVTWWSQRSNGAGPRMAS